MATNKRKSCRIAKTNVQAREASTLQNVSFSRRFSYNSQPVENGEPQDFFELSISVILEFCLIEQYREVRFRYSDL